MNWVITVNEVTDMGNRHVFSTAQLCDGGIAADVYDRLLSVYPPPQYDVVLTRWEQVITLDKRSGDEHGT